MTKATSLIHAGVLASLLLLATPQAQAAISVMQAVAVSRAIGTSDMAALSPIHAGNVSLVSVWHQSESGLGYLVNYACL
jgi:hypothetical protein